MREPKSWDEFATYDKDGFRNGIRDDAPESVRKEYEEFEKTEAQKIASKTKRIAK